jgi:hypothetical protein
MTGILREALLAQVFTGVAQLIKSVIEDDWAELIRQIPYLK